MIDLQNIIVAHLVGPFITGRPVDPEDLARLLQMSFPEMSLDELTATISRVANGIGVRVKGTHQDVRTEADFGPCA